MSIKIDKVSKKYGKQIVLNELSLDIEDGECIGLVGRNGCGKTTLLSILAGIEKPTSGRVVFADKRYRVGYLPQVNPLLEDMSVGDNLKLWADNKRNYSMALKEYELVGIEKKRVSTLSGGMKRRLSIACALVNKPDLLIMDEPTSALDIVYKDIIHKIVQVYQKNGGTIIMVTHEMEEMQMCDHIYTIVNGAIGNK